MLPCWGLLPYVRAHGGCMSEAHSTAQDAAPSQEDAGQVLGSGPSRPSYERVYQSDPWCERQVEGRSEDAAAPRRESCITTEDQCRSRRACFLTGAR